MHRALYLLEITYSPLAFCLDPEGDKEATFFVNLTNDLKFCHTIRCNLDMDTLVTKIYANLAEKIP